MNVRFVELSDAFQTADVVHAVVFSGRAYFVGLSGNVKNCLHICVHRFNLQVNPLTSIGFLWCAEIWELYAHCS